MLSLLRTNLTDPENKTGPQQGTGSLSAAASVSLTETDMTMLPLPGGLLLILVKSEWDLGEILSPGPPISGRSTAPWNLLEQPLVSRRSNVYQFHSGQSWTERVGSHTQFRGCSIMLRRGLRPHLILAGRSDAWGEWGRPVYRL